MAVNKIKLTQQVAEHLQAGEATSRQERGQEEEVLNE